MRARVALVGDYDAAVTAHRAIPEALRLGGQSLGHEVDAVWVDTDDVAPESPGERLAGFDAVWCVPASPYRSMEGAIAAIAYARTNEVPFLGTCGGFQHALIEYGRNVLGMAGTGHAEVDGSGEHLIVRLTCALVETRGRIHLTPGSRVAQAYASSAVHETYRCSYGLNHAHRRALEDGGVRMVGVDDDGDVRAFELDAHPFYVGTLFQPERAALGGEVPPLVRALLQASFAGSARPVRVAEASGTGSHGSRHGRILGPDDTFDRGGGWPVIAWS